MQRLIYSFERMQPAQGHKATHPIVGDVIVGIAMAAVRVPGLLRQVQGTAEDPLVVVTFPSDKALARFKSSDRARTRCARHQDQIRIMEETLRRNEQRAVA